jgi:hypothetical protein
MVPMGAYATEGGGWAAYDKEGCTKRVSAEQAATINANRKAKP